MLRFTLPLLAVLATAAVSFGASSFAAFSETNAVAPLSTSASPQTKNGPLFITSGGTLREATFATVSGAVGIGTDAPHPLAKLDVAGMISVSEGLATLGAVSAQEGFCSAGKNGTLGDADDLCVKNFFACSDGVDNDADGKVDYGDDTDCSSLTDNNEETSTSVAASLSLTANPTAITSGQSTRLSWSSANLVPNSCTATVSGVESNVSGWNGSGKPTTGSVSPVLSTVGDYTFALSCTKTAAAGGGTITDTTAVTVGPAVACSGSKDFYSSENFVIPPCATGDIKISAVAGGGDGGLTGSVGYGLWCYGGGGGAGGSAKDLPIPKSWLQAGDSVSVVVGTGGDGDGRETTVSSGRAGTFLRLLGGGHGEKAVDGGSAGFAGRVVAPNLLNISPPGAAGSFSDNGKRGFGGGDCGGDSGAGGWTTAFGSGYGKGGNGSGEEGHDGYVKIMWGPDSGETIEVPADIAPLKRYYNSSQGKHVGTIGNPPYGFAYEASYGYVSTEPRGLFTKAIYECGVQSGGWFSGISDYFLSPDSGCEGQSTTGYRFYVSPTTQSGFTKVLRCAAGTDHLIARTSCPPGWAHEEIHMYTKNTP